MSNTIGTGVFGAIVTIFAWLGALVGEALCIIYGIFALLPAGPFEKQNLTLGVILLVLSGVGLSGIVGAIGGLIAGSIIVSPVLCCNCEEV